MSTTHNKVSSGSINGEAAAHRASALAKRALLIIPALLTSKEKIAKSSNVLLINLFDIFLKQKWIMLSLVKVILAGRNFL